MEKVNKIKFNCDYCKFEWLTESRNAFVCPNCTEWGTEIKPDHTKNLLLKTTDSEKEQIKKVLERARK